MQGLITQLRRGASAVIAYPQFAAGLAVIFCRDSVKSGLPISSANGAFPFYDYFVGDIKMFFCFYLCHLC